jgi:glycosyltransferase involved in cell wall biosynthesis
MKRVTFLLGSYHPAFSAVGNCAFHVQKCLEDDLEISVVAFQNEKGQPFAEKLGKIDILRIETKAMRQRKKLSSRSGLINRAALMMHRLLGAARRLLAPVTIDRSLVRAYVDRLESLDRPPDAIVACVFPMESVVAALRYKELHSEVRIVPYLFDNFVESDNLHVSKIARRLKMNRHLALEGRMLAGADAVMAMHPLQKHFSAHFPQHLLDKISFLEHPLLIQPNSNEHSMTTGIAHLCYTGSLIRNLREPDYLLDLLKGIKANIPIHADFFVMGNDAAKIKTETIEGSLQINNHGRVSKDKADAAVAKANVLLNIGEVRGNQISSKIFEYMATGKPIVHLAYVKDDVVSKIIEKYPLALTLVQDRTSFEENCVRFSAFLEEKSFASIPFEDVKALYPEAMPETTAALIRDMFEGGTPLSVPKEGANFGTTSP